MDQSRHGQLYDGFADARKVLWVIFCEGQHFAFERDEAGAFRSPVQFRRGGPDGLRDLYKYAQQNGFADLVCDGIGGLLHIELADVPAILKA
jgi:hypothetical protein